MSEQQGERMSFLEQCEDADAYNALRCTYRVRVGDDVTLLRLGRWTDVPATALLLAEMGFTGSSRALPLLTSDQDEPQLRVIRRFRIPDGMEGDVMSELTTTLVGRGGGLGDVVTLAMAHHRLDRAFERAWWAAGCPPVELGEVDLVTPFAGGADGPVEPDWRSHRAVRAYFSGGKL